MASRRTPPPAGPTVRGRSGPGGAGEGSPGPDLRGEGGRRSVRTPETSSLPYPETGAVINRSGRGRGELPGQFGDLHHGWPWPFARCMQHTGPGQRPSAGRRQQVLGDRVDVQLAGPRVVGGHHEGGRRAPKCFDQCVEVEVGSVLDPSGPRLDLDDGHRGPVLGGPADGQVHPGRQLDGTAGQTAPAVPLAYAATRPAPGPASAGPGRRPGARPPPAARPARAVASARSTRPVPPDGRRRTARPGRPPSGRRSTRP